MTTGKLKAPIRQNRIKAIRIYLSLCLVASFFTGCVVLPHPMKQMARGQVMAQTANDLTPGKTTKDEVLFSFHSPTAIWEKENVFIYFWEESKSAVSLAVCGGGAETYRMWTKKMTLLQFNDQGVLMNMNIKNKRQIRKIGKYLMDWVYGKGSQESKSLIEKQELVTVIMRIVTTSDGESQNKWSSSISIKSGGFRSGGIIEDKGHNRLWGKYKKDGWVLYDVEPGNLYTSFDFLSEKGAKAYSRRKIFQAKILNSDSPIYLGSFRFNRNSYKSFLGTRWKGHQFVDILDESDLARQVAAKMFPEKPPLLTSMSVEHQGPIILTSPTDFKQPGVEIE